MRRGGKWALKRSELGGGEFFFSIGYEFLEFLLGVFQLCSSFFCIFFIFFFKPIAKCLAILSVVGGCPGYRNEFLAKCIICIVYII